MVIKSEAGIYKILEDLLKQADSPLTCVDLYEHPEVQTLVPDANKVSDLLGHMWRRELLQRWFAPESTRARARYAYTWKGNDTPSEPRPVKQKPRLAVDNRENVTVVDNADEVVLDFAQFTITIKKK